MVEDTVLSVSLWDLRTKWTFPPGMGAQGFLAVIIRVQTGTTHQEVS